MVSLYSEMVKKHTLILEASDTNQIYELLSRGQIGVLPTDTVYGVVAIASKADAVRRAYDLKNRKQKPGTVVSADVNQLVELGFKQRYLRPAESFWPGAVSVIVPCGPSLDYLTLGVGAIAVRVSSSRAFNQLLKRTGPLLTTSANQPGMCPASNIDEAFSYFGQRLDLYVDGGDLSDKEPSTVIRIIDDTLEILRRGAVQISEYGEIIK